jgi:hypothetical protein
VTSTNKNFSQGLTAPRADERQPFTLRTIKSQARPALFAWWLGWTFDGFETYALILVGPAAVSRCA